MEFTNQLVALSSEEQKASFYRKTYLHVALAILAFIFVETALLMFVPARYIAMMFSGQYTWLLIIGGFWLASILANKWTMSQSRAVQYAGLGFYVLLEAVIFLPMIYIAMSMADAGTEMLLQAGLITLMLFVGLTGVALTSNRDFSFLRGIVIIGGFIAIGLIIAGMLFGFNLGLWFSVGMVLLAAASILYQTSELKNIFTTEQYVGASLQLFSSIMLLFWYVLRILMSRKD
ncbi:MAG: Bax inhibitor-1 family protein [Flavobacteriaceae bacterium]|nr:Bax inhibitor-1 family protein [Flavobacteriaceae bacterium]